MPRHAAARRRALDRRAAAQRRGRGRGGRRDPGPHDAAAHGRRLPRAHASRIREALAVLRHSAAHMLATAVRRAAPRREDRLRSRDRGRLLLRLRGREAVHARRPRGVRGGDAQGRRRRSTRSCAPRSTRAEARKRFADDPLKLERLERVRRRRDHLDLHRRAVHRPVPRPARAGHAGAQALQAAAHRRRVLAWRREAPDAAAHLRHGWFKKEELEAYLFRIEEAKRRDHRVLGRELDLFMFHPVSPGRRVLDRARDDRSTTRSSTSCASVSAARLPGDQDAAALQQGAVGAVGPLGQVPGEHVPRARQRDGGARHVAQADELPVALPAVSREAAFVPRAAAPLRRPSTCCIATR